MPTRDTLTFFAAPQANALGDGTAERPFPSIAAALAFLAKHGAETLERERNATRCVELVWLERAGAVRRPRSRARYRFYVDRLASVDGDGSELAPWPTIGAAATDLAAGPPPDGCRCERASCSAFTVARSSPPRHSSAGSVARSCWLKRCFWRWPWCACCRLWPRSATWCIKGWPALSLDFLLSNPRNNLTAGGIWAPLIGTFCLVLLSLLLAAPIGVLAGVYLNEYARDNWMTRIINLAVVNLAGVPSIVHALFGVGAFVLFAHLGRSLLAASCTVAVMTLPVIITSTREALAAVPMSFREACWNMGATRWQTIRTLVLPNSIAGILTGVILQVARAAGETAPILFTGAVLFVPVADSGWESVLPYGIGDRFMALSYHLFTLCTQIRGVRDELLYGTAVVLIGLVLAVNSVSILLRTYLRARKRW